MATRREAAINAMQASLRAGPLLLGACAALSMSLCLTTAAPAQTPELGGVRAPGSAKESPYASTKDDEAPREASGGNHAASSS